MAYRIAIDGACRGNGKADCISGAGVFITRTIDNKIYTSTIKDYEVESTNQRGELLALKNTFKFLKDKVNNNDLSKDEPIVIITDSEYLFKMINHEWYVGWELRDWMTASGTPVKNKDLIVDITDLYITLTDKYDLSINLYHIKGHIVPVGEVTAYRLLDNDATGSDLLAHCYEKFDMFKNKKADKIERAQSLSETNNGFELDDNIFRDFVALNCAVDIIANVAVNDAQRTEDANA